MYYKKDKGVPDLWESLLIYCPAARQRIFVPLALSNECRAASLCSTELSPRQVRPPLFLYPIAPKLLVHIRP